MTGDRPPLDWLVLANRHALTTRLLSATVHDVNNTLQVVSGAAEVLAMDPTPDAVARRTDSIVAQARQATAVLQGLTAFARGTAPATPRTRLKRLADQAVALRLYALRKARITPSVSGDETECAASSERVLQILLNLLLNAEQALAGRAGATLAVHVGADGADSVLTVTDNGPGLSEAQAVAVGAWPPVESATHLGIGLLVSQTLAARDGGAVTHAPAPDGGAVFTLRLPR